MKVKEFLLKFPKVMEMDVEGLQFIHSESVEDVDDVNDIINDFTKISNTKYTGIIASLPQKFYKEYNPTWNKRNNNKVVFSIKNGTLAINDKINEYTASYKIDKDNYLTIAHEIMYYAYMRDDMTHGEKFEASEGDKTLLISAFNSIFGG